ncbi:MAG: Na+/H+ antiporter NhaA [Desulfuromonadaceae bacterium]|nr:Na+/H+ antiporter NhaA [Desulfuromonadaceae bacterium]
MIASMQRFLKLGIAGGILLFLATILALVVANSPLKPFYDILLSMRVEIRLGALFIGKPLLLWINDGLMAIFFFLIGLELKRELLVGELRELRTVALPAFGAVGGMLIPALIYYAFNRHNPIAVQGWAIPAATDIAFALGLLALFGNRLPSSLKIFLISLAIFDDIGAILIIAFFYTSDLSLTALAVSSCCLPLLLLLNRKGVVQLAPYLFVGAIMWVALLKSGVHATLAGVALALFIPLKNKQEPSNSPLRTLEHDLHPLVTFAILPLFAFANAGISLTGVGLDALFHPVPIGIALGLFVGKQLGVFTFCYAAVKLNLAGLPQGMSWSGLYGIAILCGIGFTMSLFIGSLAFEETDVEQFFDERVGILLGSLISGIAGYLVLNRVLAPSANEVLPGKTS